MKKKRRTPREQHLWEKYKISIDDYNSLFEIQKGRCAICGTHQTDLKRVLCVDHDHATGKVRGLLCSNCNHGLGQFRDSVGFLASAIKYLENNW